MAVGTPGLPGNAIMAAINSRDVRDSDRQEAVPVLAKDSIEERLGTAHRFEEMGFLMADAATRSTGRLNSSLERLEEAEIGVGVSGRRSVPEVDQEI
jgi:hypothetical protein